MLSHFLASQLVLRQRWRIKLKEHCIRTERFHGSIKGIEIRNEWIHQGKYPLLFTLVQLGDEPLPSLDTPDEQAKCLLFYLREIRRMLNVTNLFTLNDFLMRNSEVLILHLANIFTCLVRDHQLSQSLANDWTLT